MEMESVYSGFASNSSESDEEIDETEHEAIRLIQA